MFRFSSGLMRFYLLLVIFFACSEQVSAMIYGIPAVEPLGGHTNNGCGELGGVARGDGTPGFCWLSNSMSPGLFLSSSIKPGIVAHLSREFGTSFAPYRGNYRLREHICLANAPAWCTKASGQFTVDSANSVYLNASDNILSQNPDFGGAAQSVTPGGFFTICLTLVDDSGHEWRTIEPVTCEDTDYLPDTPATCYIDYGSDLDVDMGTLERRKIGTAPVYNASGSVTKNVNILCTRDAGITVSTKFQFTPIYVNGNDVVSTSTPNLGIAIYYQGELFKSSSSIVENFEVGYTTRELQFQALRDPNVDLKDIQTGDFTAGAIMIMTEQ